MDYFDFRIPFSKLLDCRLEAEDKMSHISFPIDSRGLGVYIVRVRGLSWLVKYLEMKKRI